MVTNVSHKPLKQMSSEDESVLRAVRYSKLDYFNKTDNKWKPVTCSDHQGDLLKGHLAYRHRELTTVEAKKETQLMTIINLDIAKTLKTGKANLAQHEKDLLELVPTNACAFDVYADAVFSYITINAEKPQPMKLVTIPDCTKKYITAIRMLEHAAGTEIESNEFTALLLADLPAQQEGILVLSRTS